MTPGSIVPLRELLGDLLLEIGQPAAALAEYKRSLASAPNRYRSLYGAAEGAECRRRPCRGQRLFPAACPARQQGRPRRPELAEATAYLAR